MFILDSRIFYSIWNSVHGLLLTWKWYKFHNSTGIIITHCICSYYKQSIILIQVSISLFIKLLAWHITPISSHVNLNFKTQNSIKYCSEVNFQFRARCKHKSDCTHLFNKCSRTRSFSSIRRFNPHELIWVSGDQLSQQRCINETEDTTN